VPLNPDHCRHAMTPLKSRAPEVMRSSCNRIKQTQVSPPCSAMSACASYTDMHVYCTDCQWDDSDAERSVDAYGRDLESPMLPRVDFLGVDGEQWLEGAR
jgi:hypothetical protein